MRSASSATAKRITDAALLYFKNDIEIGKQQEGRAMRASRQIDRRAVAAAGHPAWKRTLPPIVLNATRAPFAQRLLGFVVSIFIGKARGQLHFKAPGLAVLPALVGQQSRR